MKLSDNAIVIVLHKKNVKYFENFKKNFKKKNNNYDIIFFCDNISVTFQNYDNLIFLNLRKKISITGVRNYLIKHLITQNYQNVMFADLEDFFKEERAIMTFKYLKKYDVVFNDINLLKKNKIIKKNIFKNFFSGQKKINLENILNSNFFGFCNSGTKVKNLVNIEIPKNIIAIDWWIFSLILLNKKKIKFLKKISTNYRIDNMNIVGINKKINKKKLEKLIDIKYYHYLNMLYYCKKLFLNNKRNIFEQKYKYIKKIRLKSKNNKFSDELLKIINKKKYNLFNGWFNELSLENKKK